MIAASKVHTGARRVRGGALEQEGAELTRKRRRQALLKVALEFDNLLRELEYDLPSGPHVGCAWTPLSTRVKASSSLSPPAATCAVAYRRVVPCVALSVKERAKKLRDEALQLVQNHSLPDTSHTLHSTPEIEHTHTRTPTLQGSEAAASVGKREMQRMVEKEDGGEERLDEGFHLAAVLQHPVAAVVSLIITGDTLFLSSVSPPSHASTGNPRPTPARGGGQINTERQKM